MVSWSQDWKKSPEAKYWRWWCPAGLFVSETALLDPGALAGCLPFSEFLLPTVLFGMGWGE